jgi:hypothetical protein
MLTHTYKLNHFSIHEVAINCLGYISQHRANEVLRTVDTNKLYYLQVIGGTNGELATIHEHEAMLFNTSVDSSSDSQEKPSDSSQVRLL